jgi:hypothetical protein
MDVVPQKPHHRRDFYIVSFLILTIVLLVRFCLVPELFGLRAPSIPDALNAVLDALFATGLATIAIASLVLWLTPPIMARSRIDVIEPREIGPQLAKARLGTREWWYRGGCGRYTRAVTIPYIATEARAQNMTKAVTIQILDPTVPSSCREYALYRNRLRSGKQGTPWTEQSVRLDLLGTIVSAYTWRAEEPLLNVEVGLHKTFSLLRIDLSSHLAVITKEDPLEPALKCDVGSFFYDSFLEDLRLTLQQARLLPKGPIGTPRAELTAADVQRLLGELGLQFPEVLVAQDLEDIIAKVKDARNPYA